MGRTGRLVLIGAAGVVAAVGFTLARPDGEDEAPPPERPAAPAAGRSEAPRGGRSRRAVPRVERMEVRGGRPVGGVRRIDLKRGERVRLVVRSPDTSDELHLHGYDRVAPLVPGEPARLSFQATLEGVFEMELERAHVQIAKLTVRPR